MSLGKKRAISMDGESTNMSDSLKKSEREKTSGSGRLQRPVKRRRTEEPSCMPKPLEPKEASKVKKKLWTATATEAFFEGLYQHGKDFHQILKYMQSKYKKKNDPTIPRLTKNQVRFFFYRTWHKVSALLVEPSHQQQPTESKKKALKLTSGEASPQPVEERKVLGLLEEDAENPMDSSLEEPELAEGSPGLTDVSVFQEVETSAEPITEPMLDQDSPIPPVESELGEKTKEGVEPSPGGAPPNASGTTEKYEGKKDPAKDTVLVNGVKHSLDLVALICYYKLKNKCPGDHNFGKRLYELVYHGNTTVLHINRTTKGKRRVQIKVPNCRALQVAPKPSLSAGEGQGVADHGAESGLYEAEPYTPTSGPKQITVELRPFSSASWLYVQGLSQNPRLRLTVTASKTVSQLLQFLALKWQLESSSGNCVSLYHSYHKCEPTGDSPLPKESPSNPVLDREHSTEPEDISEKPLPSPSDKNSAVCSPSVQESWVPEMNACKECEDTMDYPDSLRQKQLLSNCVDTTVDDCFRTPQTVEIVQSEVCSPAENLNTPVSHPEKPHIEPCKGPISKEDFTRDHLTEDSSCESSDLQGEAAAQKLCTTAIASMGELHYKFCKPDRLQLLYELHVPEEKGTTTSLQMALKLVDFIGNTELMKKQQQPSPSIGSRASPKVAEYIRSLPKKSPHKSPLAKYYRLKNRSPFKPAMLRHPARRIKLNFDAETDACKDDVIFDKYTGNTSSKSREFIQERAESTNVPITNGLSIIVPSLKSTQVTTLLSSPSLCNPSLPKPSISMSSSPTVMSVLQMHQNSPEIIQLSKQGEPSHDCKMQLIRLPSSTLESHGSFSGMRLQSLFSTASKVVHQKGKDKESRSLENILLRPTKKSQDSRTSSPNQIQERFSVAGKICEEVHPHSPNQSSVVSETTTSLAKSTASAMSSTTGSASLISAPRPGTSLLSDVHRLPTAMISVPVLVDKKVAKQTLGRTEIKTHSGDEIPNTSKLSLLPQQTTRSVVTVTDLPSTASLTATGKILEVPSRLTFGIQASKSITQPTVVSSTPLPIVTALKPFSKPRKVKKIQSKAGQARHLVPRPLLFLPNVAGITAAQQSPGTLSGSTFTSTAVACTATTTEAPVSVTTMATSATPPGSATSTLQHQVLALVQTLLLQQQNQRIQAGLRAQTVQKIPTAVSSVGSNTASETAKTVSMNSKISQSADFNPNPSELLKKDFSDREVQGAILDNFLAEHAGDLDAASTSKLFHTSSDTVNELLRGLSSKHDDRSIQKLSEETADVLPTFAKALGDSIHSTDGVEASLNTKKLDNTIGTDPERSENNDHLPFLNEKSVSFSDILGSASDSHFKQLAEKGDLLDHIDFPDALLHLKDAATPEKPKQHESGKLSTRGQISAPDQNSEVSLGGLLDFLCSPEKLQSQPPSEAVASSVDSTYKSLLEDSSVDYIQKFRELASKMNSQS